MPYSIRVVPLSVREVVPNFRWPNADWSYELWFLRRVLPKLWVTQTYNEDELSSPSVTGVVLVTPNIVLRGLIESAIKIIRNAGFNKKILVFSPANAKYLGDCEFENVCFFATEDLTKIFDEIRKHCLLFT